MQAKGFKLASWRANAPLGLEESVVIKQLLKGGELTGLKIRGESWPLLRGDTTGATQIRASRCLT